MRLSIFIACSMGVAVAAFGVGQKLSNPSFSPIDTIVSAVSAIGNADVQHPFEEVAIEVSNSTGGKKKLAVAKYEVTFAEWQKCVEAGSCKHTPKRRKYVNDDHPVSGVSWRDVQHYIAWISKSTGYSYRLPMESEWRELAVDVLDKEVDKLFDDPRLAWAADYANFEKRAERRTHQVGHYGTEENGIADITGNVWEWTSSCWRHSTAPNTSDEVNSNCGGVRVLAGAHMTYQSELIRVVPIGGCSIGFPPANIGFRLVRDV
jgi:formylglycine-generating enzyme required for sulfatase activity